jgi:16S rRNA (guanine527-N7)-methyltransferase
MTEPGKDVTLIRGPQDFAAVFSVSSQVIDRLTIYEAVLRQWQRTTNLVAPSTLNAIWHRHFADSAQLVALAPAAHTWVDLGSGAGFPGLVVAIILAGGGVPSPIKPKPRARHDVGEGPGRGDTPTAGGIPPTPNPSPRGGGEFHAGREETIRPRVTLVESNARKCAFLREVVRQTGIAPSVSVDILSTRIEDAATQARLAGPDVITARALAPLDRLLELSVPLFTSRTVGLLLKGRDAGAELNAAKKVRSFNAELIPSRTEAGACVVAIRDLEAKGKTKGSTP